MVSTIITITVSFINIMWVFQSHKVMNQTCSCVLMRQTFECLSVWTLMWTVLCRFSPSAPRCQPEQQLVGSAVTPWCGSVDTASAAPPPQVCCNGWVHWLTVSLLGLAGMRSFSPPRHPLQQNGDASCDTLSPEEEELHSTLSCLSAELHKLDDIHWICPLMQFSEEVRDVPVCVCVCWGGYVSLCYHSWAKCHSHYVYRDTNILTLTRWRQHSE